MKTFPIDFAIGRQQIVRHVVAWLAVLAGMAGAGAMPGFAQDATGPSTPSTRQIVPPVPLEYGFSQPSPFLPGTIPPMAIGPAPGLYGPPGVVLNGPPVYFAPPVIAPPFAPIPNPYGVVPPVPLTARFAPAAPFFEQGGANGSFLTESPRAAQPSNRTGPSNFLVTLSESFLNRLIARESVEPGPVRDFILGAQVTGQQTTVSKLHVDLVPSTTKARMALVLNGDVQTLTTGVTPQAMIDTAGQQQFVAVKDVYFDGWRFSTRHATVFVRARNQTLGATTPLTGTLLGGLADRIAYYSAERQKAAGEAVARERTAERLFPKFDGEVDSQLATANQQLEQVVRKRLDAAKLLPSTVSVWTTDNRLHHASLVGLDPATATISPPADQLVGDSGITVQIHEGLLNAIVERSGLKGFKTTDRALRELRQKSLPGANDDGQLDDGESGSPSAPQLPAVTENFVTEILFDETEPLTFKLETDRLIATIKATFKPAGQAVVPPMIITIAFHTELKGEKIRWVAESPRVVAQDRTDQAAPPTIVETAIQKIIEAELTPIELDRSLPAAYWQAHGQAPRVTSIKSQDGWVGIAID